MNLELIEKIFTNTEKSLTQEEAEEKAILFLNVCFKHMDSDMVKDVFEDYWIQVSKEWDLNIYDGTIFANDSLWHLCLYPVENDTTNCSTWVDITRKFYEDGRIKVYKMA